MKIAFVCNFPEIAQTVIDAAGKAKNPKGGPQVGFSLSFYYLPSLFGQNNNDREQHLKKPATSRNE